MDKLIIVIDPGHGGIDSGATGYGYKESDIVLNYALSVGKVLNSYGIEVKYTRTTDRYLSLGDRVKIANDLQKQGYTVYFISIHLNSFSDPRSNGYETFYYRNSNQSKESGQILHSNIISGLNFRDRGLKSAGFYVIRETYMKANLIELGFISNKTDLDNVLNNKDKIVLNIVKGIAKVIKKPIKIDSVRDDNPILTIDQFNKDYFKNHNGLNLILFDKPVKAPGQIINNKSFLNLDDNTLIGLREIINNLSLELTWDNHISYINKSKQPVNNSNTELIVLGHKININAVKLNGTHYIPIDNNLVSIRSIFESMGLKVGWNKLQNIIIVE